MGELVPGFDFDKAPLYEEENTSIACFERKNNHVRASGSNV
jgi:hypothetical protein